MSFRHEIQKRIDKKRAEINGLESALAQARSYVQALEDTLRIAPRDGNDATEYATLLRSGTALAHSREAILKAGKPLHISELLKAIEKDDTKENRVSLVGSLGAYVRQGKVFTRPRPNVFGLVEQVEGNQDSSDDSEGDTALKVA